MFLPKCQSINQRSWHYCVNYVSRNPKCHMKSFLLPYCCANVISAILTGATITDISLFRAVQLPSLTHSTHSLVKIFHRKRKINSVFLPSSSVNTKSLTFYPCDGKQNENDRTLLGSWHPLEQKTTCSPSFSLSSETNILVLLMLFHISYSIRIHKECTTCFVVEFLIPTLVLQVGEEALVC